MQRWQVNSSRSRADRARYPVENQVRSRVEQDEMASQEPILDVVRKPRQHSQDVGWHCGERFVFRVGAVYLIRELSGVVVHDGRPGVGVDFEDQGLPELNTDGRREDVSLLGLRTRHTDSFARARIALLISAGSSVTVRAGSPRLQLAAKFEIVPDSRAEVSHDVAPDLYSEAGVSRSVRRCRLRVTNGTTRSQGELQVT